MQRARLLGAAVAMVDELGWSGVSVRHISARARISRRTFYEVFEDRDDCLLAMLGDAVARVEEALATADLGGGSWLERVRGGLWTILCFFEDDPALARVCVVQSAGGSQRVLEARELVLARLGRILGEGSRASSRASGVPPLTAEGLVGAAVWIVYKRLLTGEPGRLSDLRGELMEMIVLPYLGASAARAERKRPLPKRRAAQGRSSGRGVWQQDPLAEVPMRLTHRTMRVLEVTGENPGASNRMVAEGAGIYDQGQVSKLLARLQRLELMQNTSDGHAKGERNAWHLTPLGQRVTEQLSPSTPVQKEHAR
jgi:AcrR family transcriptional regulator/DNA-binding MarR family transcriptional regulator